MGCWLHLAGRVVRIERPGPIPVRSRAFILRSTVHRATGQERSSALSSRHVFLDPRASLRALDARRAAILPSTTASDSDRALGGRDLAA